MRKHVETDNRQFSCCGKSTVDAVFIPTQLQETYKQKRRKLYNVFVDLKKAFDRVPRKLIEWALKSARTACFCSHVLACTDSTVQIKGKNGEWKSEEFEIGVRCTRDSSQSINFIT